MLHDATSTQADFRCSCPLQVSQRRSLMRQVIRGTPPLFLLPVFALVAGKNSLGWLCGGGVYDFHGDPNPR